MSLYYMWKDGKIVETDDTLEWGRWMETRERILKQDRIGPLFLSTVCLGLDHQYGEGPPLIFETMMFRDGEEAYCDRYSTYEEAMKGHSEMLEVMNRMSKS